MGKARIKSRAKVRALFFPSFHPFLSFFLSFFFPHYFCLLFSFPILFCLPFLHPLFCFISVPFPLSTELWNFFQCFIMLLESIFGRRETHMNYYSASSHGCSRNISQVTLIGNILEQLISYINKNHYENKTSMF